MHIKMTHTSNHNHCRCSIYCLFSLQLLNWLFDLEQNERPSGIEFLTTDWLSVRQMGAFPQSARLSHHQSWNWAHNLWIAFRFL